MLRKKLNNMVEVHGKKKTREILLKELDDLEQKMRLATNIYYAIDVEHDRLDIESMLKWLKDV